MTAKEKNERANELYEEQRFTEAFQLYQEAANEGFANAMYNLANCYYDGVLGEKDLNQAAYWARRAFAEDPDDPDFQNCMKLTKAAVQVEKALHEERYDDAVAPLKVLAESGDLNALYELPDLFLSQVTDLIAPEEAFRWAKEGAEKCDSSAFAAQLAALYLNGQGTPQDPQAALHWATKAVSDPDLSDEDKDLTYQIFLALADLGYCQITENGSVEGAPEEASPAATAPEGTAPGSEAAEEPRVTYVPATDQDRAAALNQQAYQLAMEERYEEAFPLFRDAAELGLEEAMMNVSLCYRNGFGVEQDPQACFAWMKRAAEAGWIPAFCRLAELYEQEIGTEQDLEAARYWAERGVAEAPNEELRAASEKARKLIPYIEEANRLKADPEYAKNAAQEVISQMRDQGKVRFDEAMAALNAGRDEEAFQLFLQSAQLGHPAGIVNTALCYEIGQGTPKDLAASHYWLGIGAKNGVLSCFYGQAANCYYGRGVSVDLGQARYWIDLAMRFDPIPARKEEIRKFRENLILIRPSSEPAETLPPGIRLYNERRYLEALPYLEEAGRKGDAASLCCLGLMYNMGLGLPKDTAASVPFFLAAAARGDEPALECITRVCRPHCNNSCWKVIAYLKGTPGTENVLNEIGFSRGFVELGNAIQKELTQLQSRSPANMYYYASAYNAAAECGQPDGLAFLSTEDHIKINNRGVLPAWALLDLQNAAMMGHSGALFALGQEYNSRNQRKVADRCFLEAARRGHRQAAAICAQRDIQA